MQLKFYSRLLRYRTSQVNEARTDSHIVTLVGHEFSILLSCWDLYGRPRRTGGEHQGRCSSQIPLAGPTPSADPTDVLCTYEGTTATNGAGFLMKWSCFGRAMMGEGHSHNANPGNSDMNCIVFFVQ